MRKFISFMYCVAKNSVIKKELSKLNGAKETGVKVDISEIPSLVKLSENLRLRTNILNRVVFLSIKVISLMK